MCGCAPDTHRYTQSLAPRAEFIGFFIGFSTATTRSPLASQTPAVGGSGRASGSARAGRARGAAPGAGCTHLVPFSHQNEVNFLPKADTAVGKPGEVSAQRSHPGPPPPWAPNRGSTASRRLHLATPTAPNPVSVQKSITAPSPFPGAALTFSQFASLFRCPPRQDFGENALSFPPGLPRGHAGGTTRPGRPRTSLAVCWEANKATVSRGWARLGELSPAPGVPGSRHGGGTAPCRRAH